MDLEKYFQQYGREPLGLGWFIQRNDSHVGAMLYRAIDYAQPHERAHAMADLRIEPVTTSRHAPVASSSSR